MIKPFSLSDAEFTQTLDSVITGLAMAKEEITRRLAPFAERVPGTDVHNDADSGLPDYATDMIRYIKEVEKLRREFEDNFTAVAEKISTLGGRGWQNQNDIVQAWLALAHVVQALRHNPIKGPAAVYVSEDNKLISFSAANFWLDDMKPSEKLQRKHLTYEEGRSALNICAEPAAIAKAVGHERAETWQVLRSGKSIAKQKKFPERVPSNGDYISISKMPDRRLRYLARLTHLAKKSGIFERSILITTADPCRSCTKAVVDVGVSLVISDVDTHRHPMKPKRKAEMEKAEGTLRNHGVAHRHIAYHHNI